MVANKGASGVKLCSPPSARHNDEHLFSIAEEFPAFLHKGGEPSLSVRCMLTSLEAKIAHASGVRAVTRALSDFSKRPPYPAFLTPFVVSIYDMSLSEHCQIFRPRRGPSSYIDPGSASIERYAVCKSETGGQPIDAGATGSPVWRGREREREVIVSGGRRILAVSHLSMKRVDERVKMCKKTRAPLGVAIMLLSGLMQYSVLGQISFGTSSSSSSTSNSRPGSNPRLSFSSRPSSSSRPVSGSSSESFSTNVKSLISSETLFSLGSITHLPNGWGRGWEGENLRLPVRIRKPRLSGMSGGS